MPLYLGVRVEVSSKLANTRKLKTYNQKYKSSQIFDITTNGKIAVEKIGDMLVARGRKDDDSSGNNSMVNFSLMLKQNSNSKSNIERIVKIVNVLGNDRLIRERVHTFFNGDSLLNNIPELELLVEAFKNVDMLVPGIINAGWYYAPEAMFK